MPDKDIYQSHGINDDEKKLLLDSLGREPTITEIGIFSVMWSEHCSYKSSRYWLKELHTSGKQVIQGPGENAGVVDIGDNQAVIFKMESHNHPSFIEPYQGAATGVGGIMRDVFTMGARPIALLNSLRFGEINHPKTKYLLSGVVGGIGGYYELIDNMADLNHEEHESMIEWCGKRFDPTAIDILEINRRYNRIKL